MKNDRKMVINLSIELTDELISAISVAVVSALGKMSYAGFNPKSGFDFPNEYDGTSELLTPQDIADYLQKSRRRVYDLLRLEPQFGGIPSFKVGSGRRVRRDDFLKWLESRERG
ncbi:helix-turn-helix domain-containing protein [Cohnella xylanilytica]|uniref:Helix-turn-helix domain-containing protein n=1 Tax=Cohnella xylanilytica TaxID=557555 RepID=A0A841U2L9_9BACL|nr:helix-turn-helix domain-containing protein [Cohnella xylanilytica]MBB6692340.1 helix-turn-helix domain-containing protein [Cohnella xylanilytica]